VPCHCCEITDNTFGEGDARSDIKHYRKHGPANQTRLILEGIRSLEFKDAALLEEEAARRGHTGRVQFVHADFTDVASELPIADIVTLDRVVCCYPDFRALLKAAAGRGRCALAMTYPRETWYMRLALSLLNFVQRLRMDPFRVFLHPVAEMESLLNVEGFERLSLRRLFVWEVALYRRSI